jgi:hypothetical protein
MSISDRVDRFPEPWKPAPGDKLVGTVAGLDERTTEYGTYPIVTIQTDTGQELDFHAFHTVAKNELARQRPVVGDEIAVKYFGRDDERGYERYRVVIEHAQKPEAAVNWDTIASEAADELGAVESAT